MDDKFLSTHGVNQGRKNLTVVDGDQSPLFDSAGRYRGTYNPYSLATGFGITATAAEINRAADVSGRVVTLTATTAIVEATHEGKTLVMAETGGNALATFTLPAATGGGARYRFVVGVVNTSNYVIAVVGDDIMQGGILTNSTGDTPDLAQFWPTAADSDTITLNGTTTGGVSIGDYIELEDIAANTWAVRGVTTSSGTEATPFSAAVS